MEKKINAMLSDFVVFYHKLQCYHWYVKGNDFFVIHTTLQKCYEEIKEQLDELAESALMIGYSPVATMKDFTNMASIKEAKAEFVNSKDIIKDILADYQHLLEATEELKKEAEENEVHLISVLTDELLSCYSKKIWMLSQSQM